MTLKTKLSEEDKNRIYKSFVEHWNDPILN